MREEHHTPPHAAPIPAWAWAMLAILLAARLLILFTTPAQLYPDEAQYWGWAQTPALGYYSKPPLTAWLIALTTGLFGDAEWAARLSAPLCHVGAAAALMLLTRDLYGRAAAGLAGALWLTIPAVSLSSIIISTDAPLLLCWSIALLGFFRMIESPASSRSWMWGAIFGAAVGAGFLAKYAMVYALIGVGLIAAFDAPARRALFSRTGLAALICALIVVAPNLIWNALNGMSTLRHTADNADWGPSLFHPIELLSFWASQFGAFGPVLFPLTVASIALAIMGRLDRRALRLAAFAAPPLLIVSVQAFLAHAYANWAAASFPAGVVLCAGLLLNAAPRRRRTGVALTLGGNALFSAALTTALLAPQAVDALGLTNAFKRTRGWAQTTEAVMDAAAQGGFATIAFDDRFSFHAADYYGRDRAQHDSVRIWRRYDAPVNHAETCCSLTLTDAGPILLASRFDSAYAPWFEADFTNLTPVGEVVIPLGGGLENRLRLYRADGFAPVSPRAGDTPPR